MRIWTLCLAMLATGCLNGYPEDPHAPNADVREPPPAPGEVPDWDDYDYGDSGNLDLTNGYLSGDMGEVRGFEGAATSAYGSYYGDYVDMQITTTRSGQYSAMALVGLSGGLDNPALVPGARLHFANYGTDQGVTMSVTGCSGPREGSWAFDAPAEDVTLEVSEGSIEGNLLLDFDATFSGNGTTHGSVEVTVPQS